MPDWSYQTVFRPLLFRLPVETARSLSLGVVGRLGELPFDGHCINFLGHMRPAAGLETSIDGVSFASPIGLGAEIDPKLRASCAFGHFGFGFIEVGPISIRPRKESGTIELHPRDLCWSAPKTTYAMGVEELAQKLELAKRNGLPKIARLEVESGTSPGRAAEELGWIIDRLDRSIQVFMIVPLYAEWSSEEIRTFLSRLYDIRVSAVAIQPLWITIRHDSGVESTLRFVEFAMTLGMHTFKVEGTLSAANGETLVGRLSREPALEIVRKLRSQFGHQIRIIAAGGIHEPIDALRMRQAGADLLVIDSGLIFGGPGLPKRINEAISHFECKYNYINIISINQSESVFEKSWIWTTLMGLGMLIGSILALVISATRIVLPYDEVFVGMTRSQLAHVNPRLLSFMAHDRVTLSGTMITIGTIYTGLSLFGISRGMHWAWKTVVISALIGFFSFFLFLGFGYFDPFHAFVTTVLLQFLLMGLHSRLGIETQDSEPSLRNDRAWHLSLWAQLIFVIQSIGFIGAGLVIATIGVTTVFVPEDLKFMSTTISAISASNPRLVPLVAHDRATFGGMLVSTGIAFLTSTLWGFRAGRSWLWWTFLLAGIPGYTAAIAVHLIVGYNDHWHLTPAFGGLMLFSFGLALAYPFLCGQSRQNDADWRFSQEDGTGS